MNLQTLPGHAARSLDPISRLAETANEEQLLFELSKSHATRQLLGRLTRGGIYKQVRAIYDTTDDKALKTRIQHAFERTNVEVHKAA